MKIYQLKTKQKIPVSLDYAWDFFSNPNNLAKITPAKLNFTIKSELPPKMRAGMIIIYNVRPLLNIPITWVTEITHVEEPFYFVDEQRIGPYKLWHHEHIFQRDDNGGTLMEDIVSYAIPLGFIGRIVHCLIIRKKIKEIFEFRTQTLKDLFPHSEKPEIFPEHVIT
jgi:ligand-binding SRPBCC domain-containing protein